MSPLRSAGLAGHVATTAHVQAAYPFMAETGLGPHGPYIGRDIYGGAFCYDPFHLYQQGALTNPNCLVIGQVGRGKSALLKTYLLRQIVFGRQAWIVDIKGEYAPLARALGIEPIRLEPRGRVTLNPLTPKGGPQRQLDLVGSIAAAALARPLQPVERTALHTALKTATETAKGREVTLPDLVHALLHPDGRIAADLAMTPVQALDATRELALALRELCSGALAGMFDSPTTPGLNLDAPMVVLDLSAVLTASPVALAVLMACATAWLRATIDQEPAGEGHQRIVVVDEAWRVLSSLGVGEWLQQSFKLSRGLGVQNVVVMHRLTDLEATGAAGSREVRLAEGLLADTETKVIYAQPQDQIPRTRELLGLTDTEASLLPTLGRGWALWKVGRRSFLAQHRLTPLEHALVNTDQKMTEAPR